MHFTIAAQFDSQNVPVAEAALDGPEYEMNMYSARSNAREPWEANGAVTAWLQDMKSKPYIDEGSVTLDKIYDDRSALLTGNSLADPDSKR